MTKSDLKNGMGVQTVNGKRYFVIGGVLEGDNSYIDLAYYNEDLTCKECVSNEGHDIVKIYRISEGELISFVNKTLKYAKLLWQRKLVRKVTMEELEKMFGCRVEVVSKNVPEFKGCWGCDDRRKCPDADSDKAQGCNNYVW